MTFDFLWDVHEWDNQLNITIFNISELVLLRSSVMKSIERKDIMLNLIKKDKISSWVESTIVWKLVFLCIMTDPVFSL